MLNFRKVNKLTYFNIVISQETNIKGRVMQWNNLTRRWQILRKKLEIPPDVSLPLTGSVTRTDSHCLLRLPTGVSEVLIRTEALSSLSSEGTHGW